MNYTKISSEEVSGTMTKRAGNDADAQHPLDRIIRLCSDCGSEITACMGFVHAGDFVSGKIPPRELCGRCVLLRDIRGEI